MTTQPELPESLPDAALAPTRPALRLAPPPAEHDVDFDAFVRSYEARLRRLVMRRIGDLCEAEEITQETLLRAYQHRASFATEDELMAWSTVVAQRLVIDRVRVRGRSVAVAEVPETARLGRDTAEIVVARHEARAALESLEAIPTRQAAILWAREVEGLHYEEIAERFGITEPAVRSLLHRGRRALREEFKNRTGSLPLNGLAPFAPWLLALKAAGKVRGVAKTITKTPATAVAALSLTALVAVSIGALRTGTADAGGIAIAPTRDGAAQVHVLGEPVQAVARETVATRTTNARMNVSTARSSGVLSTLGVSVSRHKSCAAGHCVWDDGYFAGATIQVGPDLPDNPARAGNVKVSQEMFTCSDLAIPANPAVTCTQNDPSNHADRSYAVSEVPGPPAVPSSEGVTR